MGLLSKQSDYRAFALYSSQYILEKKERFLLDIRYLFLVGDKHYTKTFFLDFDFGLQRLG